MHKSWWKKIYPISSIKIYGDWNLPIHLTLWTKNNHLISITIQKNNIAQETVVGMLHLLSTCLIPQIGDLVGVAVQCSNYLNKTLQTINKMD